MRSSRARTLAGRENAVIGVHLCRGNYAGRWLSDGSYEQIAEKLLSSLSVDHFLLEYDDQRAGDFSVLRFMPPGKCAVLGLISTKTPVTQYTQV